MNNMNNILQWYDSNRLSINPTKTVYMLICPKKNKSPTTRFQPNLRGIPLRRIQKEETTKLLGFTLDETLSYESHIDCITSKLRSANFALRKTKNLLNTANKLMLYRAIFESHLMYGTSIWAYHLSSKQIKTITTIQKTAIRLVYGAKYNAHTEPLFKTLKILKFVDLIEQQKMLLMYKANNELLPSTLSTLLTGTRNTRNTRQTHKKNQTTITTDSDKVHNLKSLWRNNNIAKDGTLKQLKRTLLKNTLCNYRKTCEIPKCNICKQQK